MSFGEDAIVNLKGNNQLSPVLQQVQNQFNQAANSMKAQIQQLQSSVTTFNQPIQNVNTHIQQFNAQGQQVTNTLRQVNGQFQAGVQPITQAGNAIANNNQQVKNFLNVNSNLNNGLKNTAGSLNTFAVGISATATGFYQMSANIRDLNDAQIQVDRTTRRVSLAQEALGKAQAKLNDLQSKGITSGAEYEQAVLDINQAQEQLRIQTQLVGEAQERLSDFQANFYLSIIPATTGALGTLGSAFQALGVHLDDVLKKFNGLKGIAGIGGATIFAGLGAFVGFQQFDIVSKLNEINDALARGAITAQQAEERLVSLQTAMGNADFLNKWISGFNGLSETINNMIADVQRKQLPSLMDKIIGDPAFQSAPADLKEKIKKNVDFIIAAVNREENWVKMKEVRNTFGEKAFVVDEAASKEYAKTSMDRIIKALSEIEGLRQESPFVQNLLTQIRADKAFEVEARYLGKNMGLEIMKGVVDGFQTTGGGGARGMGDSLLNQMTKEVIEASPLASTRMAQEIIPDVIDAVTNPSIWAGASTEFEKLIIWESLKKGAMSAMDEVINITTKGVDTSIDKLNALNQEFEDGINKLVDAWHRARGDKDTLGLERGFDKALERFDKFQANFAAKLDKFSQDPLGKAPEVSQWLIDWVDKNAEGMSDEAHAIFDPVINWIDEHRDLAQKSPLDFVTEFVAFLNGYDPNLGTYFQNLINQAKEGGADAGAAWSQSFEDNMVDIDPYKDLSPEVRKALGIPEKKGGKKGDGGKITPVKDVIGGGPGLTPMHDKAKMLRLSYPQGGGGGKGGTPTSAEGEFASTAFGLTGKGMGAANPNDILARQIDQITKNYNVLARAINQVTTNFNTHARVIVQVTKDYNLMARAIVQTTKDYNIFARATVQVTNDNNILARTIVQLTKNNNVYAQTIVQITQDLKDMITEIKGLTNANNTAARTINQMSRNLRTFASDVKKATSEVKNLKSAISSLKSKTVTVSVKVSGGGKGGQEGFFDILTGGGNGAVVDGVAVGEHGFPEVMRIRPTRGRSLKEDFGGDALPMGLGGIANRFQGFPCVIKLVTPDGRIISELTLPHLLQHLGAMR